MIVIQKFMSNKINSYTKNTVKKLIVASRWNVFLRNTIEYNVYFLITSILWIFLAKFSPLFFGGGGMYRHQQTMTNKPFSPIG